MGYGNWGFWQYGIAAGGVVVIFGLLLWAVYAVTRTSCQPKDEYRSDGACQTLDERLARGELDPEEHKALRDLIAGDLAPVADGAES